MSKYSRLSLALTLLGGVSLVGLDVAQAKGPNLNLNFNIKPATPIAPVNIGRISPVPLDIGRAAMRTLGPAAEVTVSARSRRLPGRARKPATKGTDLVAVPAVRNRNLANGAARGQQPSSRIGLPAVQDTPTVPLPPELPVDQALVDGIIVMGGAPGWWQEMKKWSDIMHGGIGAFAPDFLPGAGDRPEIDLNPFGPDRAGKSHERGVGPNGWPGGARDNAGFKDPSGQVSQGWVIEHHSQRREGNATVWVETGTMGNSRYGHTFTLYDDGRTRTEDAYRSPDGTVDSYIAVTGPDGTEGKSAHYRDGVQVTDNEVILTDPIVIPADGKPSEEKPGSEKSKDGQPGAEGPGRPRGGARTASCNWWGCVDGGVSTPVRSNPGHGTNEGGNVGGGGSRTGIGAVSDPTPMDDTTTGTSGGYHDPAPGGDPGSPDGPGTR
jgi:hypothetical protein